MAHAILRTSQDSSPHTTATSPTPSSSGPSNEDIEAVIQMATSASNGRSPAPKDTRTQLFVGNLPYRVRWQDLKDLFRKAGTVLRADVSLGPDNRSRGYGTVLLATAEDAGRAVDMFNGYNWQTRTLEVRPDRIAPDFDSPVPSLATPSAGYHSPSYTFPIPSSLRSMPYNSVASDPLMTTNTSGLSIPTLPPSLDDGSQGLSLSRPGTAAGNGSRNLFVGNLPFHCQWQDLKDLFRQAGTVIRADVALGPDGRSRGFGTVTFATEFDAERGLKIFNGYEFNGRPLKVHFDKFSPAQSSTVPTSPTPQMTFQTAPHFGGYTSPPNHIPIPFQYFEYGPSSGPSSPYDVYPPYLVMQHALVQQQSSQPNQLPSPQLQEAQPPSSDAQVQSSDTISSTVAIPQTPIAPGSSPFSSSIAQSTPSNPHYPHPGRIALPPPSVSGFPPPHTLSPHAISPLHHPMSPMHHPHVLSMTPHGLPPITPSMPSFTFLPQPSPSMHGPHHLTNSSTPGYEGVPGVVAGHIMTSYGPFSPGLTMSPGTVWGRPEPGVNPYAAVGAPVHVQHTPYGMYAGSPATLRDDPGGYFPPVPPQDYFPFVPPSSSLANEVIPDGYSEDGGRTQASHEKTVPSSYAINGINGESARLMNNWPTGDDDDDDDDRDVEIVTGSMETFRLNGQNIQPRASSLVTRNGGTMESEKGRPTAISMTSSTRLTHGTHKSGSNSEEIFLDEQSLSASTSAPSTGHRRASFAEIVSEGTSPVPRKADALGLGIRVPST